MWNKVARVILRYRIALLIIVGLITIFMGYQASLIEMDYHYASMLSKKHPVLIDNVKFKQTFGEEGNGIFVGFESDDFFELKNFQALQNLCEELKKIDRVTNVLTVSSAVNARQITVTDENGVNKRQFEIYNIFPDKVTSQAELDSLKEVFFSLPFYENLLYNKEKNVFMMNVSIDKEILNSKARIPVVLKVEEVVKEFAEAQNIEVYVSGLPFIRTKMMDLIKSEIILFIVLAALVCVIILYLYFRSFKVIGVAMLVVGVSVTWAVGFMGIFGFRITILSGMVPPLLIVIGIPNTIYLLNRYHTETKAHGNKILALQRVITKIGNAVFLSNATTAVGFTSFIITNSSVMVEFGIIATLGIISTFINALIMLPAIFSFLQPPSNKYTKHLNNKYLSKVLNGITNIVTNHRRKIYATIAVILILSAFGVTLMKRTGYILDDVSQDSEIYVATKFLEKNFGGVSPVEIAVQSKDSLKGYEMITQMEKIDSLQQKLKQYPELSRSLSIVDALKFLNQAYSKGDADKYALPSSPDKYKNIFQRLPEGGLNQNIAQSFIDSTRTITRISLNIEDIGTNRMKELIPKIENDINTVFPKDKYNTLITGNSILYFTGTSYLINNLISSLALAIVLIGLLMLGLQRSFKMVGILLIPNLIPMLVTAGLMGYFGVPIKPSTILIFGISLGISVDGAIHFITRYRQEVFVNGWNVVGAVKKAISETGISMVYTYSILFFGFLIFTFSGFGGITALGFLISMTLLVAMIGNLILLPSMLISFEKYITKKDFPEPIMEIYEDDDEDNEEVEINEIEEKDKIY